nr:pinin [Crassostrea gigas]
MASVGQWKPNPIPTKFYLDREETDSNQINSDIPPTSRDGFSFTRSLSDDKDASPGTLQSDNRKDLAIRNSSDRLNGNNCEGYQDINKMGKDTLQNSSPADGHSGNVITSHLKHVQSNPFFLNCGVTHPHGRILDDQQKRKTSLQEDRDSESGAEYGVNSGFVNKLKQKFTTLNQREESSNRFPPRRFASVENLLQSSEKITFEERTKPFGSARSKTVEQNSNYVRKKPALPKPPRPPKLAPERKRSDSEVELKHHKSSYSEHEAPDINKIGRNDIIIIEHSKPAPIKDKSKEEETPTKMNGQTIKALKDKKNDDDLPKPNTVSSFRSMFEKNNSSVSRKLLPDAPKVTSARPSKLRVNRKEAAGSSPLSSPINKSPDVKEEKPKDIPAETTKEVVRPSTVKERAQETPRSLDSPVTRKKTYAEKKSIFDSDFQHQTSLLQKLKHLKRHYQDRKQIFDSSQISSSNSLSSSSAKKKRAPKPPSSTSASSVENKPDIAAIDVVKKSETSSIGTTSVVTKKPEPASIPTPTPEPTPRTPRAQPSKVITTSEPSPVPWLAQDQFSSKSSKVEKTESVVSSGKVNNFTPIEVSSSNDNKPTRGLPSVIANRLNKKTKNVPDSKEDNDVSSDDDVQPNLVKPSQLRNSNSLFKVSDSPSVPNTQNSDSPSETQNSNTNVPVRNIEDLIRKKRDKPAALFDSSSIVPKVQNGIPPLDLTDLVTDQQNHPYQEGYIPSKIKPCNIVFLGSGVLLETKPLKKSRSGHSLRIQFDDKAVSTHEYQSETSALAQYLEENPHEKDVVEKEQADIEQTSISLDLENSESSDDVVETPRDTVAMKSNTAIGAGELSNYKSKIQLEEFQFGMSMAEPEPSLATTQETEVNPDDLDLLPAEDENSIHFTGTETSDMLF